MLHSINIVCWIIWQGQLGRIAAIYIPWLGIVLDNLNRLTAVHESSDQHTDLHHMYSSSSRFSNSSLFLNLKDSGTSASTPKSLNRFTLHLDGNSSGRASTHFRDSSYFAAIAGQGETFVWSRALGQVRPASLACVCVCVGGGGLCRKLRRVMILHFDVYVFIKCLAA